MEREIELRELEIEREAEEETETESRLPLARQGLGPSVSRSAGGIFSWLFCVFNLRQMHKMESRTGATCHLDQLNHRLHLVFLFSPLQGDWGAGEGGKECSA